MTETLKTIPTSNGDYQLRGVAELHGRFTAHTSADSKTFKTRAGAIRWLASRGISESGEWLR